jgi:beta-xylosidase
MKWTLSLTLAVVIALLLQNNADAQIVTTGKKSGKNKWIEYKNPIISAYLADPYIRYENGFYYLFATGVAEDKRYIPVYRSKDLSTWEFVRGAVNNGQKEDWNYKHFWAPEVIKIKEKFYLYFTASPDISPANSGNRVGVAVADNIEGPYQTIGVVIPNGSIDGHPVFDKDSTMYIYYTIEWQNSKGYKAGQIYMDKMLSPTQVADDPKPLITHHNWQEGAFLLQRDNAYYLTYSCGAWSDSTYHLRYARSGLITGPYTEQRDTIIKSNAMVKGPGHHSIFKDQNNGDWIVYHGWDTAYTARYPRIDPIRLVNGKISCSGPSYTSQKVSLAPKPGTKPKIK